MTISTQSSAAALHAKRGFICDMDGVIYHGERLLPGALEFVNWLRAQKKKFLFLTNNSSLTPLELKRRLERLGIATEEENFYTSAQATAGFLASQCPGGTAFVIGDTGLTNALYEAGFTMDSQSPDYVVVGESRSYDYEKIECAVQCILAGAKFVGANPDMTGPTDHGIVPACGALVAPIEAATGRKAYFVGKPNPLMMRQALRRIGCTREETVIIGDRMDTDIVAGIESEIDTVLVLTGVTTREELPRYAYQPRYVLENVGMVAGE
jgi:NagD protein